MNDKNNLNNLSSKIDKANVGISYKKPKNIKNRQLIVLIISGVFMCGTIIGAGFAINEAIKVLNKKNTNVVEKQKFEIEDVFKTLLKTKIIS